MKNFWTSKIDNIDNACNAMQAYLNEWYENNKHKLKELVQKTAYIGYELNDAKKKFIELNPEYKKYDRQIIVEFKGVPNSYQPRCLDGCCVERERVCGVSVTTNTYAQMRKLAGLIK